MDAKFNIKALNVTMENFQNMNIPKIIYPGQLGANVAVNVCLDMNIPVLITDEVTKITYKLERDSENYKLNRLG